MLRCILMSLWCILIVLVIFKEKSEWYNKTISNHIFFFFLMEFLKLFLKKKQKQIFFVSVLWLMFWKAWTLIENATEWSGVFLLNERWMLSCQVWSATEKRYLSFFFFFSFTSCSLERELVWGSGSNSLFMSEPWALYDQHIVGIMSPKILKGILYTEHLWACLKYNEAACISSYKSNGTR